MISLAVVAAAAGAWASGGASFDRPDHAGSPSYDGPDRSELDLLRPRAGWPQIYVQARYPDGSTGIFLVDTGADISVMHRATAERLGLDIELGRMSIEGLSGRNAAALAVLPELRLGDAVVPGVEFAIDVRGLPEKADFLPVDGLIGNNVWSRFVVEIDYPADLLVLHRPDTVRLPRRQEVMFYDGHHVFSPLTVTTPGPGGNPRKGGTTHTLIAQVDTGAVQLTLCATTGAPFVGAYTEGIEELRGIGASETLPPYRFLEETRRVDVARVELGGLAYPMATSARWLDFERTDTDECGVGSFKALLGHEYLEGHRVFFDYAHNRLSLSGSRRPERQLDGHQVLLDQDRAEHGDAPARATFQAELLIGAGREDDARALLTRVGADGAATPEEVAQRQVMLARLHRAAGDLAASWRVLEGVDPGHLVDEDEIVATVNSLLFGQELDQARALATAAVQARPDAGWAHVALADALLVGGEAERANEELLEAARLEQFPEAHLLRRARVALAAGDRYGAMAHVRKLLQLYPFGGYFLWFYALLLDGEPDAATFRSDMAHAMARLHPRGRPIDFQVAAHEALGEHDQALALLREGVARHCEGDDGEPEYDNCLAWFQALGRHETDDALRRIERALAATGPRSDFLDTLAMVHLARGELEAARAAAWEAARLSPDDVYMSWQAERIGDLLGGETTSAAPAPEGAAIAGREAPPPPRSTPSTPN